MQASDCFVGPGSKPNNKNGGTFPGKFDLLFDAKRHSNSVEAWFN
jgi:hypothetical protein